MTLLRYDTPKDIRFARWIAHGLSLLLTGFVLIFLVFNEDSRANLNLPTVIFLALTLSTLIAWRWERTGGLLTLLLSPLFLLAMAFQWSRTEGIITPTWQIALIGISMTIPFLIIGGLFLYVGNQSQSESDILDKDFLKEESKRPPYLAYVIVGMLSLLALFFFANSFLTPIQQQMEFPESRYFPDDNIVTDRSGVRAGQEIATAVKPTGVPGSPRDTYVLFFTTAEGAETVSLRIGMNGRIVRLDNLGQFPVDEYFKQRASDLLDSPPQNEIFSSEAGQILVFPPAMQSPEDGDD